MSTLREKYEQSKRNHHGYTRPQATQNRDSILLRRDKSPLNTTNYKNTSPIKKIDRFSPGVTAPHFLYKSAVNDKITKPNKVSTLKEKKGGMISRLSSYLISKLGNNEMPKAGKESKPNVWFSEEEPLPLQTLQRENSKFEQLKISYEDELRKLEEELEDKINEIQKLKEQLRETKMQQVTRDYRVESMHNENEKQRLVQLSKSIQEQQEILDAKAKKIEREQMKLNQEKRDFEKKQQDYINMRNDLMTKLPLLHGNEKEKENEKQEIDIDGNAKDNIDVINGIKSKTYSQSLPPSIYSKIPTQNSILSNSNNHDKSLNKLLKFVNKALDEWQLQWDQFQKLFSEFTHKDNFEIARDLDFKLDSYNKIRERVNNYKEMPPRILQKPQIGYLFKNLKDNLNKTLQTRQNQYDSLNESNLEMNLLLASNFNISQELKDDDFRQKYCIFFGKKKRILHEMKVLIDVLLQLNQLIEYRNNYVDLKVSSHPGIITSTPRYIN